MKVVARLARRGARDKRWRGGPDSGSLSVGLAAQAIVGAAAMGGEEKVVVLVG